jgi:hypothetical protein
MGEGALSGLGEAELHLKQRPSLPVRSRLCQEVSHYRWRKTVLDGACRQDLP